MIDVELRHGRHASEPTRRPIGNRTDSEVLGLGWPLGVSEAGARDLGRTAGRKHQMAAGDPVVEHKGRLPGNSNAMQSGEIPMLLPIG